MLKIKLLYLLLLLQFFSCTNYNKQIKKNNNLLSLWLPFSSKRTKQAYEHSLIRTSRLSSDCGKNCPDIDVWQYKYKNITSDKPISTQKKYWKSPNEARVIAISLFGTNEFYYNALLQYIDSFAYIKNINNIKDKIWGYETFTVRVYVPKRNPKFLKELGVIGGGLEQKKIDKLLDLGCEIAFVDNKLSEAKKDATFWRFMITQEAMLEGEKIRYLLRDADSILTAGEMYTVADWINSHKKYHRMHTIPICIGPLTASIWGGTHSEKGDFSDFYDSVKNYPYRFEYGDDELFLRDIIWPKIKFSGSVLTHHFDRDSYITKIANPYKNSCEEPTQDFCLQLNPNSQCEDRILPNVKNLQGAVEALGLRKTLKELSEKHPEFFDLDLANKDRKFVYETFR